MKRVYRVDGLPVPQGSMKGYVRGNRAILTSDNPKLKDWRKQVKAVAETANEPKLEGAIEAHAWFYLPRPKSLAKRVLFPIKKPDLDKLVRAIGDAISDAGVWNDDSQVTDWHIHKRFADAEIPIGVWFSLEEIEA